MCQFCHSWIKCTSIFVRLAELCPHFVSICPLLTLQFFNWPTFDRTMFQLAHFWPYTVSLGPLLTEQCFNWPTFDRTLFHLTHFWPYNVSLDLPVPAGQRFPWPCPQVWVPVKWWWTPAFRWLESSMRATRPSSPQVCWGGRWSQRARGGTSQPGGESTEATKSEKIYL